MRWRVVGDLLPAGDSPALVVPSGALTHQLVDEGESFQHMGGHGGSHGESAGLWPVSSLVGDEGELQAGTVGKGEAGDERKVKSRGRIT